MSGELGVGRVDAAEDLRRAVGQQPPGGSEADPASDALQQLRAGLGLQSREVVRHGGLRVAELLRRRGDGFVARDGVEHAQAGHVEHGSTLSMNQRKSWHWTYEPLGRKL